MDKKIFFIMNRPHSVIWDKILYCITHEFFWAPFYLILLYLIIQKLRYKTWLSLLSIFVLITICDQFASGFIKPWVQRPRPCLCTDIKDTIQVAGKYQGEYGFISSHAANTFGLSIFLWLLLKNYYPYLCLLFLWASIVSFARVCEGVHYPTDILVGAISGLWWGWGMHKIYMSMELYCWKK